ncbi:hypothetical protein NECAME_02868 [Necator americanus]|uniref:Uncharacterized protein n=1 Tax=Necator americanus TaxID=51031 RepID=W2TB58_NECAM|nr:hypothetical protein NECAME_02868 [Necator americanus]ETN78431.1 hypothetical protein NECAME_02868 [Necator americanus]
MASRGLPSVAHPGEHERSVSDGDVEVEKKRRKTRRRRANKNRFKPYHSLSPEEKMALDAAETARSERRTRERMANGKPMAPSNTTQFLLEDREARAEQGREVELAYEASERRRVRSISVSSEFMAASEGASSSGDSETDKEMDREFEAEFEEYTMDRLSRLTKDEMTREILDKEKNAELYQENITKMMKENQRLRKMLQDNGIPVDHNHTSQPVV